jgi:hypothetical protein
MEDRHSFIPIGRAAAWQIGLKQGTVDEHASQQFEPPARDSGSGAEIDERRVAKLSCGWGVHV